MSIRYYCDACGKEVAYNLVGNRLKRKLGRIRVEVLVATDGTWNAGHCCLACLLDVINNGEDFHR